MIRSFLKVWKEGFENDFLKAPNFVLLGAKMGSPLPRLKHPIG